jgi:hypothetical protein
MREVVMMNPDQIKSQAYDTIVSKCQSVIGHYMSHRPRADEMADWSKEDLRDMFLELVDCIEYTDYVVGETISGQQQSK